MFLWLIIECIHSDSLELKIIQVVVVIRCILTPADLKLLDLHEATIASVAFVGPDDSFFIDPKLRDCDKPPQKISSSHASRSS